MVTIPDVPILEVGSYLLSTGPATFTEEDLVAAIAALEDPAVKAPRIKIDGLAASFDPEAHGGEPAFGRVEAMRLSGDGQAIIGDLVVPAWLGDVVEWAYPARSIEGGWGWVSATGRRHQFVISALALLGVDLPGVTTLDDLPDLLSGATVGAPTEVVARMPAQTVRAGIDSELVRQRYYAWIETNGDGLPEGSEPWAFWVRSLRFDDGGEAYLKVTDDTTGRLYRVDFEVSGSDVSFGTHTEVVEQDVPVAAGAPRPRPALAAWATRADSRPATPARASGPATTQEDRMDPAEVRRSLGLAEDATDDEVTAAFARARGEQPAEGEGEQQAETPAAETPAEPVAVAASAEPAGPATVQVSAAALAELRSQAERVAKAHQTQLEERRDAAIAKGLDTGRFPVADKDAWKAYPGRHPEGFEAGVAAMEARIEELAPGLIPVGPEKGAAASAGGEGEGGQDFNYLFPQLAGASKEA